MRKELCPCGRPVTQVIPGVYLCTNELWPHLWRGIGGISDSTSLKMAAEIVRLTAENQRLTGQVERWQRAAGAHDDFLDSLDKLQAAAGQELSL